MFQIKVNNMKISKHRMKSMHRAPSPKFIRFVEEDSFLANLKRIGMELKESRQRIAGCTSILNNTTRKYTNSKHKVWHRGDSRVANCRITLNI